MFDLFKLHSEKDTPKGWIWVNLKSDLLRDEYVKLLNKRSQWDISLEVSKKLKSGFSTIEKHLIRLKNSQNELWIPLPIVIEVVSTINKSGLKEKIIKDITFLLCKSSITKQKIKAVKNLNENLAKLIGAHIADGYLKSERNTYRLKITDGRSELIKICGYWIKETFGFNPIIRFSKEDNAYNCWFNNKIIGRYIENIFKISSGKKSYIVREPKLIKDSSLRIRNAFLAGILNFDGCVKTTGMVSLTSMSKELIEDVKDIFNLNEIKTNVGYNKNKKSWLIETCSSRELKNHKKLLHFFEIGSWKYDRLTFFINKDRGYSLEKLNYLFPNYHLSKISLNDVYNSIKTIKSGKINEILNEIRNKQNISKITLYKYLYILEKSNLVYKTNEKNTNGKNYWCETIYNINLI